MCFRLVFNAVRHAVSNCAHLTVALLLWAAAVPFRGILTVLAWIFRLVHFILIGKSRVSEINQGAAGAFICDHTETGWERVPFRYGLIYTPKRAAFG